MMKTFQKDHLGKGIYLVFMFLFMACHPNHSVQTPGDSSIQGIWEEELGPDQQDSLNQEFTLYHFRFQCDSVFIIQEVHDKNIHEDGTCFSNGLWKEYQKAGYVLQGDSIFLEGVYTKPNFKMKASGCHHFGNFHESYKILKRIPVIVSSPKIGDQILLLSPHSNEKIWLRRIQVSRCKLLGG